MSAAVLEREMYTDVEAARLLRVPPTTFRRWLDGGSRGTTRYQPVIRPEPTGSRTVTWGEFIEASYLRQYRRDHDVVLQHLREFIKDLRDRFGIAYPLAHAKPWIGPGRKLLVASQEKVGLEPELWTAYEPRSGVVLLTAPSESFLGHVTFSDQEKMRPVVALHPMGKESPVVIDPDLRFGLPSVRGISTVVLVEAIRAGESVEALAHDYDLTIADLAAAISYEAQTAA